MRVSAEEIRRLAALARLELAEAEVERMARELDSILAHMAVLARVPPGEAGPPEGGAPSAPLRPDRVEFDPLRRPPAEIAPAWAEGFFVVPRIPELG